MSGHVCKPRWETESALRDGSRSSMREICPVCQKTTTYLQKNDGAVVTLDTSDRGRK